MCETLPLSVASRRPRVLFPKADDEPTVPMKKPIGPLGMTAEEVAAFRRTKKWPPRQVEAPERPPGLTLTSLPSVEYLRGYAAGYQAALRPRGPRRQIARDITLIVKFLEETGGNVEKARKLFIVEVGRTRLIVEQPRARLIVGQTKTRFIVRQTGKRVIDLTPEQRSVISKRFTRAMREIRRSD